MGLVWLLRAAHRQLSSTLYNTCTQSLRKGKQSLFFFLSISFLSEKTQISHAGHVRHHAFSQNWSAIAHHQATPTTAKKKKRTVQTGISSLDGMNVSRIAEQRSSKEPFYPNRVQKKRGENSSPHTSRPTQVTFQPVLKGRKKKKLPASLRRRQPKNTNWPDTTPSRVTTTTATGNEIREH